MQSCCELVDQRLPVPSAVFPLLDVSKETHEKLTRRCVKQRGGGGGQSGFASELTERVTLLMVTSLEVRTS